MGMRSIDQGSVPAATISAGVRAAELPASGGPGVFGPGLTGYDFVAAEAGSYIHLHSVLIEADEDCTWTIWSAASVALIGPHTLKADQPPTLWICPLPAGVRAALEEPLRLEVSSNTATFTATRHYTVRT